MSKSWANITSHTNTSTNNLASNPPLPSNKSSVASPSSNAAASANSRSWASISNAPASASASASASAAPASTATSAAPAASVAKPSSPVAAASTSTPAATKTSAAPAAAPSSWAAKIAASAAAAPNVLPAPIKPPSIVQAKQNFIAHLGKDKEQDKKDKDHNNKDQNKNRNNRNNYQNKNQSKNNASPYFELLLALYPAPDQARKLLADLLPLTGFKATALDVWPNYQHVSLLKFAFKDDAPIAAQLKTIIHDLFHSKQFTISQLNEAILPFAKERGFSLALQLLQILQERAARFPAAIEFTASSWSAHESERKGKSYGVVNLKISEAQQNELKVLLEDVQNAVHDAFPGQVGVSNVKLDTRLHVTFGKYGGFEEAWKEKKSSLGAKWDDAIPFAENTTLQLSFSDFRLSHPGSDIVHVWINESTQDEAGKFVDPDNHITHFFVWQRQHGSAADALSASLSSLSLSSSSTPSSAASSSSSSA